MQTATRVKKAEDRIRELHTQAQDGEPTPAQPAEPAAPAQQANPTDPPDGGDPQKAKPDLKDLLTPVDTAPTGEDRGMDFRPQYEVLKGKYNKEVPQLMAENEFLKRRLEALEDDIKNLKAGQPASDPSGGKRLSHVRGELGDEIADELEGVLGAGSGDDSRIDSIEQSMASLQETLNQVNESIGRREAIEAQTAQEKFFANLDAAVPQWKTIYNSREFVDWSRETNPLSDSGMSYNETINRAFDRFNVTPIVRVFNEFLKSVGFEPATPGSLDEQIVPKSARGGGDQPTGEVRKWTPEKIEAFKRDVRRGKYTGPDGAAQVAKIAAEIQRELTQRSQ